MSAGVIALLVVAGVIVLIGIILVIWIVATYNKFIRLRNNADEAYSTMDVYMKKRYDLIPNLVETVKGYAKHEEKTLERVMQARYSCMSANTPEEKAKYENMLSGTLNNYRLFPKNVNILYSMHSV